MRPWFCVHGVSRMYATPTWQFPICREVFVRHSGESRNPGGHEWKKVHHWAIRYGRRDSLNPGFFHRFWIPAFAGMTAVDNPEEGLPTTKTAPLRSGYIGYAGGDKRIRSEGKGPTPRKGLLKGVVEKTPEDGNCCDTIPEVQAESGCRLLS